MDREREIEREREIGRTEKGAAERGERGKRETEGENSDGEAETEWGRGEGHRVRRTE